MPDWTREQSSAAIAEGWDLFYCSDYSHAPFELERVDFPEDDSDSPFESDMDVWKHVVERANAGSELHSAALAFLKEQSPVEYRHVVNGISYADDPYDGDEDPIRADPRCADCREPIVLDDPEDPESWVHAENANDGGKHTARI